jgi:TPR repeat protein
MLPVAEQGHASAQSALGVMYDNGYGVLENDKTAVMWYTKAAEQGYARAQYNLGWMYATGEGVLTDYVRAYMWYDLGAYNSYRLGAEKKAKIAKKMTSTDISKAQDMSSRCLASNYTDC